MPEVGKPVLAIDIDDVILPFNDVFLDYYNQQNGTSHRSADMKNYHVDELLGISREDWHRLLQEYVDTEHYQNISPNPATLTALKRLKEIYELDIITARLTEPEDTHEALSRHFPEVFRDIHFIRRYRPDGVKVTKSEVCIDIGAQLIVDDSLENILECAEAGIAGVLFGDYGWNRSDRLPHNVVRANDWESVCKILL